MNLFFAAADFKVYLQKLFAMVIRRWKDTIRQDPWDTGLSFWLLPTTPPTSVLAATSRQVKLIDDGMKQRMVEGLAAETGMNKQWARKCLDECNWDNTSRSFY
ncbi:hypothetical protein L798_14562 [Zootermopsis nevadensis]|uniref:TAP-C domain-containing protein n=1 Tax=Zootermopsis nevadensis TaxID=136037 RepID=A0A067QPT6_ZOONE|nr:hypothetical protein L798_14562 [Zootermopsis nevadensis]